MAYLRATVWGAVSGDLILAMLLYFVPDRSDAPSIWAAVTAYLTFVASAFVAMMVGVLPSTAVLVLLMAWLERRYDEAKRLRCWLIAAVATGFPATFALYGLMNFGDPAPGHEKPHIVAGLWFGLFASAVGGAVAWFSRRSSGPDLA